MFPQHIKFKINKITHSSSCNYNNGSFTVFFIRILRAENDSEIKLGLEDK